MKYICRTCGKENCKLWCYEFAYCQDNEDRIELRCSRCLFDFGASVSLIEDSAKRIRRINLGIGEIWVPALSRRPYYDAPGVWHYQMLLFDDDFRRDWDALLFDLPFFCLPKILDLKR